MKKFLLKGIPLRKPMMTALLKTDHRQNPWVVDIVQALGIRQNTIHWEQERVKFYVLFSLLSEVKA